MTFGVYGKDTGDLQGFLREKEFSSGSIVAAARTSEQDDSKLELLTASASRGKVPQCCCYNGRTAAAGPAGRRAAGRAGVPAAETALGLPCAVPPPARPNLKTEQSEGKESIVGQFRPFVL
ncbi:uncharacterized protein LOC117647743 [Thrips palmi]|uniref:Uncharacterized protein LOC117647743 n=1 Tax=Thrips palmi TaxID=161013 RepID=A0A6P8Z6F7_THRPL|nr:uncharacterized protein LOC117647743 [Thrips palmi]